MKKGLHIQRASLAGTGLAVVLCAGGMAVISRLLLAEKVREESVVYLVPIMRLFAVLVGSWVAAILIKERRCIAALSVGVVFLTVTFVAGMCMEGHFERLVMNIASAAVGTAISCVLCLKNQRNGVYKKRRYR